MPLIAATPEEQLERLSQELHVLVVLLSNAWGGLEQTALSDVRLLQQAGFRVMLLVRDGSPIHAAATDTPGLQVVTVSEKVRNYFDQGLIRKIRQLVDKHGINLVHCHQTTLLGSIVPALFRRPRVALVASRHILNSHNKRDPIHALIYRRVDYVLVLSQTMKRNLRATMPLEEKKLRTVNLGIDLARFDPSRAVRSLREEWGIPENAFLVGVVGRLDPMKGQDLVVKALAQVRTRHKDVYGIMVGDETPGLEGEYLRELETSIEQLRLSDTIKVSSAQKNVPDVMAALDLFVMPSWSEAFGLVALEAMAMGRPCVLSRSGSAEELALASGSELFRPRDAYDLARKLTELKENQERRGRMSESGRAFVAQNHTMQHRLEKTLEIYLRCYRRRISS